MDTAKRTIAQETSRVYDAFISYSHAADDLLAPRLQSGLQRFAKPWWKRRALRIFRDESSLSANPHLWSSITEALDSSGWFVLLLSPDAANSGWVNQEIEYWREHQDASRIIPVLTDGTFEWTNGDVSGTAVPAQLKGSFAEEPRWVDMRFAQDETDLDLKDPRFADSVADIASGLRGVPKDELASEEVRQHRRTIRTAWGAGVLVLLLGIAAAFAAIQASQNAAEAQRQADIAAANAAAEAEARGEADANAAAAQREADRADANAEEALRSAAIAESRELAASAIGVLSDNPELATLLTIAAVDRAPAEDEIPVEVITSLWRAGANHRLLGVIDTGGHGHTHIALVPGTSQVLVSHQDSRTLELWDANTHERVWNTSTPEPAQPGRPVVNPTGNRAAVPLFVAAHHHNGEPAEAVPVSIGIFDIDTGDMIERLDLSGCTEAPFVAFAPDGSRLAVGGGGAAPCPRDGVDTDRWVEVFETDSYSSIAILPVDEPEDREAILPRFDALGRLYVLSPFDKVQIWDTDLTTRETQDGSGYGDVTPDGTALVLSTFPLDTNVVIHEISSGMTTDQLARLTTWPTQTGVNVSTDGRRVAVGTVGSDTHVFSLETGQLDFSVPSGAAADALFSDDGTLLFTSHQDGVVKIWSTRGGVFGRTPSGDLGQNDWVQSNSITVSSTIGGFEGRRVSDLSRSEAFLFNTATGQMVESLEAFEVRALSGDKFAYLGHDELWHLYDPSPGSSQPLVANCDVDLVIGCPDPDWELSVSVDGSEVVIFPRDQTERRYMYDPITRLARLSEELSAEGVLGLFDSDWYVTDMFPEGLFAFDRTTGDELWQWDFGGWIQASPTGRYFAITGGNQFPTVVVDTTNWTERELASELGQVRGSAFDPSETRVALADEVGIHIVELASGEIVQFVPLSNPSDVHWIDNSSLVAVGNDGLFVTIDLNVDNLIDSARRSVTRSFTDQECATYRIDPCPTLQEIRAG